MKLPARYKPDWYRVKYSVAALHANTAAQLLASAAVLGQSAEAERTLAESRKESVKATGHAWDLARTSAMTIRELEVGLLDDPRAWWRRTRALSSPERAGLIAFLGKTMEPPAFVLLAGLLSSQEPSRMTDQPAIDHEALARTLDRAEPDSSLDPQVLISYVEKLQPREPRTDYNLACLYVSRGDLPKAAERLRQSIDSTPVQQRPRMIDRALKDPTLGMWQTEVGKELKEELEKERKRLSSESPS